MLKKCHRRFPPALRVRCNLSIYYLLPRSTSSICFIMEKVSFTTSESSLSIRGSSRWYIWLDRGYSVFRVFWNSSSSLPYTEFVFGLARLGDLLLFDCLSFSYLVLGGIRLSTSFSYSLSILFSGELSATYSLECLALPVVFWLGVFSIFLLILVYVEATYSLSYLY